MSEKDETRLLEEEPNQREVVPTNAILFYRREGIEGNNDPNKQPKTFLSIRVSL